MLPHLYASAKLLLVSMEGGNVCNCTAHTSISADTHSSSEVSTLNNCQREHV